MTIEQYPVGYYEEHEDKRGRHSSWFIHVFDISKNEKAKEWKNLRRVIHVHKKMYTPRTKKETHNDRYYISDLYQTDAEKFHKGIRGHWKIENSLHWVKDVIHNEDKNRYKVKNAPMNMSTFSSIAINILRKNGNHSITEGQIKFGAKVSELFKLLRT